MLEWSGCRRAWSSTLELGERARLVLRVLNSSQRSGASRLAASLVLAGALTASARPAFAQPAPPGHEADLTGVWTNDPPAETRAFQNFAFTAEPPAMTAWAQARYEAARPSRGARGVAVADTDDPVYDCFPPGTPRVYLHPFPMEIVQTPGRVLMVFEYDHLMRQIYTDGRPHRTDLAPGWMGDSIGRWEDDTLVVESVNFNDKTWIDRRGLPHSDQLRVVERIRRLDEDTLRIEITIHDPVAFVEPWSAERFYRKTDWQIEEFVCMDNVNFEAFENAVLEYDDD